MASISVAVVVADFHEQYQLAGTGPFHELVAGDGGRDGPIQPLILVQVRGPDTQGPMDPRVVGSLHPMVERNVVESGIEALTQRGGCGEQT